MTQLSVREAALPPSVRCAKVPSRRRDGAVRWRINSLRHSRLLASIALPFGALRKRRPPAARPTPWPRASRLRVLPRRGGRGHQRRLFSAAGGQARGLSLQPAGRVPGRAAQIPADELSAGISARPLPASRWPSISPRCGRHFRRPRSPTVSNEILARGESLVTERRSAARRPALRRLPRPDASAAWSRRSPACSACAPATSARSSAAGATAPAPPPRPTACRSSPACLTEDDVKAVAAYLSSRPAPADPSFAPARQPADAARLRQPTELRGDRADAANLESCCCRLLLAVVAARRGRVRRRSDRAAGCGADRRANISPAPATASPATPRAKASCLPAACRCRRRSARSIRPTSRPTRRPASAHGRPTSSTR